MVIGNIHHLSYDDCRFYRAVGKMRKFAYVGDRLSIVNSGEWACCTVVVRSNLIKFE